MADGGPGSAQDQAPLPVAAPLSTPALTPPQWSAQAVTAAAHLGVSGTVRLLSGPTAAAAAELAPGSALELAMAAARAEGELARGSSSPNPPVGAVILAPDGRLVGRGHTAPAGGAHAEINALHQAGELARGGTAVVTLEPCNHWGRTGPCSEALIAAGVAQVVFAVPDPNPAAAGGADRLVEAGLAVVGNLGAIPAALGALGGWLTRQAHGRPRITWKTATSLDGRISAPDGNSQWITGGLARAEVHLERSRIDALVVGTGTALADDPTITARTPDGKLYPHQPLRLVMGERALPATARVFAAGPGLVPGRQVRTREAQAVVAGLPENVLDLQVEGGAQVAGAFLAAGLVDRIHAYLAPFVLGAGQSALAADGVKTLSDGDRFAPVAVEAFGSDIRWTLARLE